MMTDDRGVSLMPASQEASCSALVTVSTPGSATPICRLGRSQEILGGLTVRQLIERVTSPSSLLSVQIPFAQLDAERPTAAAVSELLAAGCCEVVLSGDADGGERVVTLEESAAGITQAQVGPQGSAFLNINLEVRPTRDAVPPATGERRQLALPEVVEVAPQEELARAELVSVPAVSDSIPASEAPLPEDEMALAEPEPSVGQAKAQPGLVTIVAQPTPKRERAKPRRDAHSEERKEYMRKADWLRAQFLPEIQALDFSGLFVGNLGFGVREAHGRRNVVLADPARVTDILLRGNSYRRSNDHAKALICYQELVDMDPANGDFRFLLAKTLLALNQKAEAVEALGRARDLGHEGARKELEQLKAALPRSRRPLGFFRFWKQ